MVSLENNLNNFKELVRDITLEELETLEVKSGASEENGTRYRLSISFYKK